jgi:thymidylate kinase
MALDTTHSEVLKSYPKAVIHLRRQFKEKRFGLVLGAGVSIDFKVPLWPDLVKKIATDPAVNGTHLLTGDVDKKSLPYKTEMLFQRFKENSPVDPKLSALTAQSAITANWLELCANHIYADVEADFPAALDSHPYFKSLLPLVQGSNLAITFNFDDCLERGLALRKKASDPGKGFEVVTDPWPQFRRADSVVYHPHGMVPFKGKLMELPVDRFVFSEAAYSAQYVGSRGHDSSFLLTHFARNTCLFLGCALEDDLRNVLMRGALINPGNYHYYIHFIPSETSGPDAEQRALISETNFNIYNLITLFLTPTKIRALLELLDTDVVKDSMIKDLASQTGTQVHYHYYLTGAIGVGKSTTANLLRSLHVLDEWLETRPEVLAKPWSALNDAERAEADDWIIGQFRAKNDTLRHMEPAVSIVDRPPLDPLAFTDPAKRPSKAASLLDKICPQRSWSVEPGLVILLKGDPHVLTARVRARGRKDYSKDLLEKMESDLLEIYQGIGIHQIDTRHLSILEVTKKVAAIVHREPYVPFDLMKALLEHEGKASVGP